MENRADKKIITWPFLFFAVAMLGLCFLPRLYEPFRHAKQVFNRHTIPVSMLRLGETGKIATLFMRQGSLSPKIKGIDSELKPEEMPSSTMITGEDLDYNIPVISVCTDPENLNNKDFGIVANPFKRGTRWERPAYFSYFKDHKLIFATGAGLRVHGGKSRSLKRKSFRLYFRNIYGKKAIDGRLFGGMGSMEYHSLILHNDQRSKVFKDGRIEKWQFMNPMAYDIASEIGCYVPKTQPVIFYLNGKMQGLYFLTDHFSNDYFRKKLGNDRFVFVRTRRDKGSSTPIENGDKNIYEKFLTWLNYTEKPLSLSHAKSTVDIENLTRWFISVLFCGTTDAFQGPLILDKNQKKPRWYWVNWDMDHSFMDLYSSANNPWEIDIFNTILDYGYGRNKPRSILLNRLRLESPEFKEYFKKIFSECLNYRITKSFLDERFDYYSGLSEEANLENKQFLYDTKAFLENRHGVLWKQVQKYFNTGPVYQCRINSDDGASAINADGYSIGPEFSGYYFANSHIKLSVGDSAKERFLHWIINGKIRSGGETEIDLLLKGDTIVEAKFK